MTLLDTRFKEAIKTALAMVLAYGIVLQMGWDNPHWAALTVATVGLSTAGMSLNRSLMRASGTLVGAAAALAILGLFPQERWSMMLCLALYLGFCTYMLTGKTRQYFWFLAGFTSLLIMVDAAPPTPQGAFQTAVMRTVETATGALVYSLVAVFLWPLSSVGAFNDSSRRLWATQAHLCRIYQDLLSGKGPTEDSRPLRTQEVQLLTRVAQLLNIAQMESYQVWRLRHQWRRFHDQSTVLMETLEQLCAGFPDIQRLKLTKLLPNLEPFFSELDLRFEQIEAMLAGEAPIRTPQPARLTIDKAEMRALAMFEKAAVAGTHAQLENLERLSRSLYDCVAYIRGHTQALETPSEATRRGRLAFDPDRFEAAVRVMVTFCVAFIIWIYIDPPGDAGFAMMAAIFALIMALVPQASVSLLFLSWGLGAVFGGVLYIYIMPHLTGFAELGLMIFGATFAIYYLFGAPRQTLAKFFGACAFIIVAAIDNQQTYSFAKYANTTAMLMLGLALAVAMMYFPASPRPEKAFLRLLHRYFRHAKILTSSLAVGGNQRNGIAEWWKRYFYPNDLIELPGKLTACGQQIDYRMLPRTTPEHVQALVTSLQVLAFRFKAVEEAHQIPQSDQLVGSLHNEINAWRSTLESFLGRWADNAASDTNVDFGEQFEAIQSKIESRMGEALASLDRESLSDEHLKNIYWLLGGYRGLSEAMIGYARLADGINWAELREEMF